MGAVLVNLDAGFFFRLGVSVAADVWPALDDDDFQAQLVGCSFGHRKAEKTGAYNY